jgi:hypothetical protein
MKEQNRKENVQLIITLDQAGRPVYKDGAPALLNHALSRLKNVLQGQVLHCAEEAYSACKEFHVAPHLLDMNGSHIDDITKMYREDNFDYQAGLHNHEIGHFMVDYHHSAIHRLVQRSNTPSLMGFASRIHIAQLFNQKAPEGAVVGAVLFDEAALDANGYVLERTDWESLNYRTGGPTCGRIRHLVYRHTSIPKSYPAVLSLDNSAWAAQAAARTKRDIERRVDVNPDGIVDPTLGFGTVKHDVIDPITGYRRPSWG